jgi:hypothetical protein
VHVCIRFAHLHIVHPCEDKQRNDCSPDADCTKEPASGRDGYSCQCKSGFIDASKNDKPGMMEGPVEPVCPFAGRVCTALENECKTGKADCSPNALCIDLETGYTCKCNDGYKDTNPSRAGRFCDLGVSTEPML